MALELKCINVTGLFGQFDVRITLKENTLVIVGENGSGKSTLINLIFYVLTCQLDKLKELPFSSCTVVLGDQSFLLKREVLSRDRDVECQGGVAARFLRRRLASFEWERLNSVIGTKTPEFWLEHPRVLDLAIGHRVSRSVLIDYLRELVRSKKSEIQGDAAALEGYVRTNIDTQILFLPTYRRIEKELSALFPSADIEEDISRVERIREEMREDKSFVEFVEFGMADVETSLKTTLSSLDRDFRGTLYRLTGEYLRDIIRNQYEANNLTELASPETARAVDIMLSRMGDNILHATDRERLRGLLKSIVSGHLLTESQCILAYFLSRLAGIHVEQQTRERPIREFVRVCNEYLSGKQFNFDPVRFSLDLFRVSKAGSSSETPAPIPLGGLSSGEKQIVSLFCHLYLGRFKEAFLLIDEPELSISVEWQRRFLEDVRGTGRCVGLVAVTHSPFIFENGLSDYAHSMHEFLCSPSEGER